MFENNGMPGLECVGSGGSTNSIRGADDLRVIVRERGLGNRRVTLSDTRSRGRRPHWFGRARAMRGSVNGIRGSYRGRVNRNESIRGRGNGGHRGSLSRGNRCRLPMRGRRRRRGGMKRGNVSRTDIKGNLHNVNYRAWY